MGNQLSGDTLENAVRVLNQCNIFSCHIDAENVRRLAKTSEFLVIQSSENLFLKMDPSDAVFIIVEGEVESDEFFGTITKRGKHELIGEESCYEEECLRLFRVRALKKTVVLRLRRDVLMKFASRSEPITHILREIRRIADRYKVSILSKVPFWKSLSSDRLLQLGSVMRYQIFDSQDNICVEDDIGEDWYVLCGGRTIVTKEQDGGQIILLEMTEGTNFGEAVLVENTARTATVTATCECLVLALERSKFQEFISLCPGAENSLLQMIRQRTVDNLKAYHVPILKSMSNDSMSLIAQVCKIRHTLPHEVVCKEGEEGNSFYLIAKGELDIRSSAAGFIKTVVGGEYFGEVSMVTDAPRSATIACASECVLLEINKRDFIKIMEREPQALAEMEIRILKTESQLHSVINHPLACAAFEAMLKKELSEENILFWKVADWFRIVYGSGSRVKFSARNARVRRPSINLSERGSIVLTGQAAERLMEPTASTIPASSTSRSRSPPRGDKLSSFRRMTSFSKVQSSLSNRGSDCSDDHFDAPKLSSSSSAASSFSPPSRSKSFLMSLPKFSFRGTPQGLDLKEEVDVKRNVSASAVGNTSTRKGDIDAVAPKPDVVARPVSTNINNNDDKKTEDVSVSFAATGTSNGDKPTSMDYPPALDGSEVVTFSPMNVDVITISPIRTKSRTDIATPPQLSLNGPPSPRSTASGSTAQSPLLSSPNRPRSVAVPIHDSDLIEPCEEFDVLDRIVGDDERPALKSLADALITSGKETSAIAARRKVNLWDRRRMALKIYNTYISEASTKQVNIPYAFRRKIDNFIKENKFPADMFEESKTEVYDLMKDPFRRFKTTHAFEDLLIELKAFEGNFVKSVGQKLTSKIVAHARAKAAAPTFNAGAFNNEDDELSVVQVIEDPRYNDDGDEEDYVPRQIGVASPPSTIKKQILVDGKGTECFRNPTRNSNSMSSDRK